MGYVDAATVILHEPFSPRWLCITENTPQLYRDSLRVLMCLLYLLFSMSCLTVKGMRECLHFFDFTPSDRCVQDKPVLLPGHFGKPQEKLEMAWPCHHLAISRPRSLTASLPGELRVAPRAPSHGGQAFGLHNY